MVKCSYKWIVVYQDHLTKYCVLRPLTPEGAAGGGLRGSLLLHGPPRILQSDNGSEMTSTVITELKRQWSYTYCLIIDTD